MPAPGVDPVFDMYVKAFGSMDRDRPPRHYLDVLVVYADGAEHFTSTSDSATDSFTASWLAGGVIGTLTVSGRGDDAQISGSVRSLASVEQVELQAVTHDDGLKLAGRPTISVRFAEGPPIAVGPRDYNGIQFITEFLARMNTQST